MGHPAAETDSRIPGCCGHRPDGSGWHGRNNDLRGNGAVGRDARCVGCHTQDRRPCSRTNTGKPKKSRSTKRTRPRSRRRKESEPRAGDARIPLQTRDHPLRTRLQGPPTAAAHATRSHRPQCLQGITRKRSSPPKWMLGRQHSCGSKESPTLCPAIQGTSSTARGRPRRHVKYVDIRTGTSKEALTDVKGSLPASNDGRRGREGQQPQAPQSQPSQSPQAPPPPSHQCQPRSADCRRPCARRSSRGCCSGGRHTHRCPHRPGIGGCPPMCQRGSPRAGHTSFQQMRSTPPHTTPRQCGDSPKTGDSDTQQRWTDLREPSKSNRGCPLQDHMLGFACTSTSEAGPKKLLSAIRVLEKFGWIDRLVVPMDWKFVEAISAFHAAVASWRPWKPWKPQG